MSFDHTEVWKSPLCSGLRPRVVKRKSSGALPSIRPASVAATVAEIDTVRRDFAVLGLPR